MEHQICFECSILQPLTEKTVKAICQWEYAPPYDAYSFKGHANRYLLDTSTWGTEQFCLVENGMLLGQVSCQYDGSSLWVGWAMAPQFCGKGYGTIFVEKCIAELRRIKRHSGRILLRVAARNQRAIRAYQKAGFRYTETVQDEIAYSEMIEDFWIMEL